MHVTLGELIDRGVASLQTGPFGSQLHKSDYVSQGVPVVPTEAIGWRKLDVSVMPHIDDNTAARLTRHRVRTGDILFARRGIQATGLSAIVEPQHEGLICGTGAIRLRLDAASGVDPTYLSFFLIMNETREWLRAHAVGAVMPNLNETVLRGVPVWIPSLAEQHAIADVLKSLDDKIEQNRRTGRKLEELARAVFNAWFVDFEPVKAKAAGATAFPGMPPETFATLPNTLKDSPLGPVPLGWEVKALADTVKLTMGQSPKSEFYNEEGRGLPFHQGVTDYGFRFPSDRVYCTAEGRIAEPGDILLSVRAPVGRINVADRRLILGRGLGGMRHVDDQQSFLLYQMFHVFAEEDAIGDGTIYKAVNKDFLVMMPLIAPPKTIRDAFEAIAWPMDELIVSVENESAKLATLRDYLLPRLLSGRVRVEASKLESPCLT